VTDHDRLCRAQIGAVVGISAALLPVKQSVRAESQPAHTKQSKTETVYLSRTGKKHHRTGCVHLRQGKISVTLKDAKGLHAMQSLSSAPMSGPTRSVRRSAALIAAHIKL
jgi:hypothetical protein